MHPFYSPFPCNYGQDGQLIFSRMITDIWTSSGVCLHNCLAPPVKAYEEPAGCVNWQGLMSCFNPHQSMIKGPYRALMGISMSMCDLTLCTAICRRLAVVGKRDHSRWS